MMWVSVDSKEKKVNQTNEDVQRSMKSLITLMTTDFGRLLISEITEIIYNRRGKLKSIRTEENHFGCIDFLPKN